MFAPFTFEGRLGRLPYALWSLAVFFSQHIATWISYKAQGTSLRLDAEFFILPLRSLVLHGGTANLTLFLALCYLLVAAWALTALSFRRAADAGISEWIAAAAISPGVQIPVLAVLSLAPSRASERSVAGDPGAETRIELRTAAVGILAGVGSTLVAVALGALVFGSYGYGMFLVTPLIVGAIAGYLGNRRGDIGFHQSLMLAASAVLLGALALVGVALEGFVCILMAAPIGIFAALVGGELGRAIALATRRRPHQMIFGLTVLPLVFGAESAIPPETNFDTTETITIAAPPERVWMSIVRMDSIEEPLSFPFRLGLAYPLRGEVIGSGIGAVRYGVFSTGTAVERVTEWVPERKLTFVVEKDVPGLWELSPYAHVHAPHVVGYFVTRSTSFELRPLPDGGTEIVEHTSHSLKLDPVLYWLPVARWVVHLNNQRVLAHIKHRAEGV